MSILYKFLKMGCFCGKETLQIEGITYHLKSHIGEGLVILYKCIELRLIAKVLIVQKLSFFERKIIFL